MSGDDTTNYSDELSELIRTEADPEVDLEFYTESADDVGVGQEEINRIKTDILNILRLMSKLDKEIGKLKDKFSVLSGKSVDKLLNQIMERLDRKANKSDLRVMDARLDNFDNFLRGTSVDSEDGEEVTNLQKYVRTVINEEFEESIQDLRDEVARLKKFVIRRRHFV